MWGYWSNEKEGEEENFLNRGKIERKRRGVWQIDSKTFESSTFETFAIALQCDLRDQTCLKVLTKKKEEKSNLKLMEAAN